MTSVMHSGGIVAVAAVVTMLLRFLPFILFPESKEVPKLLVYLSKVLPAAIMGMLVVYCFRNLNIMEASHGLPELLATIMVVGTYLWKKNFLISIAAGTIFYMVLVQVVFI